MSSTNKQLQQTIDIALRDNERLVNSNKELEKKIYDLEYADGVVECEMKAEILRLKADKKILEKEVGEWKEGHNRVCENKDKLKQSLFLRDKKIEDLICRMKSLKTEKGFMQDRIEELKQYLSNAKSTIKDNWIDSGIIDDETANEINDLKEERDHYMKMAQETADLKEEVKKLKVSNQLHINENNQLKKNNPITLELKMLLLEDRVKALESKTNWPPFISPSPNNPWIQPLTQPNPIIYRDTDTGKTDITFNSKAPEPF